MTPRRLQHLVMEHQWIVRMLTMRALNIYPFLDMEDLTQEAQLSMCCAAKSYDPRRSSFSTHAYWAVRGAITKCLRSHQKHRYAGPNGGVILRLDEQAFRDDEGDLTVTLLDTLASPVESPEDAASRAEVAAMTIRLLRSVVQTTQEQVVAQRRLLQGVLQSEVGRSMGLTRQRAQQIEADLMRRLRMRVRASVLPQDKPKQSPARKRRAAKRPVAVRKTKRRQARRRSSRGR